MRDPIPPTVCERCRSNVAACEAVRLFAGRLCCGACDHDETEPRTEREHP